MFDLAEEFKKNVQQNLQRQHAERVAADAAADELERVRVEARTKAQGLLTEQIARNALEAMSGEAKAKHGMERWPEFVSAICRCEGFGDADYLQKHFGSRIGGYSGTPIGPKGMKAALAAESSGTTGGYIVPQTMKDAILADALARTIFRGNGAVSVPFAGRSLMLPTPDVTTPQAAGTPPWAGGLTFAWTAEAQTRTESEPVFKQVEICKWGIAAYLRISRPLYDDGLAFPAYLRQLIGTAVAWMEDYGFLQGSGAGQPLGVLNSAASVAVTRNTSGKFVAANAQSMIAKLPPGSYDRAVWAVNPSVLGASGWAGVSGIIPNGDLKLYGRPVLPTDCLPPLGTKGDVMLLDPTQYLIGDHVEPNGSLEIAVSEHVNLQQNQVVIRVLRRVDGRPWLDGPITAADGVTQLSPFIVLN